MPVSKEKFEVIKNKWGQYASWAIWENTQPGDRVKARIGDLDIFKPTDELLNTLRTDIVLVALNAADRDIPEVAFSPFHDSSSHAMDYKMRYAFKDTSLWGSYITDIFHNLRETDSSKVNKFLAINPAYTASQIERFTEELEDIAGSNNKPILIALGRKVKELLDMYVADKYVVYELPHYSFSGLNKEKYREKTLKLLKEIHQNNPNIDT